MDFMLPLLIVLPLLLGAKGASKTASTMIKYDFPDVQSISNVPFAIGASNPLFPVITKNKRGGEVAYRKKDGKYVGNAARSFGAKRADGARKHAGIDLYCNAGDIVRACEDGQVVGIQGFLGQTKAILIQNHSGIVCLYGEVKNNSWNEFGVLKNHFVEKGQAIARVGITPGGSSMLHFETYKKGTLQNTPWYSNKNPPSNLLNPTKYLLQAQKSFTNA
ncbi:MAG: M23 family metallopeptidase [Flavobacteriaceae bacterium]|nr:M23 family metallopeptidase [Flavobacteriaceae bacterium]